MACNPRRDLHIINLMRDKCHGLFERHGFAFRDEPGVSLLPKLGKEQVLADLNPVNTLHDWKVRSRDNSQQPGGKFEMPLEDIQVGKTGRDWKGSPVVPNFPEKKMRLSENHQGLSG